MLALRRILFPTDFGPCAGRAFAYATFWAAQHDAELHVLHVDTGDETGHEAPPPTLTSPAVRVLERTVEAESPVEAILDASRSADLVVMGTHGRLGARRLTIGSTTESVLRRADCPVLAVGPGAPPDAPEPIDRILVPVDFSDASRTALAVADALAALYGARVDALHAAFVPDLPEVYGVGIQVSETYATLTDRAGESLRTLARGALSPAHRGQVVVRVGPPGPTILAEARQLGAGLLVMPTQGRTGWARLALGSVAEHVLRRAPCPVLALPVQGRIPLPPPLT